MFTSVISTPIGPLLIRANDRAVCYIGFPELIPEELPNNFTRLAAVQLSEYFAGHRQHFDFDFEQQGTDFQQIVWKELLNIQAGYPVSYATLSKKLNNPLAIRAIAAANGRNNLMIAIPCHRVIGSDGRLVGYAGGLWRKEWLLQHENRMTARGQTLMTF